MSDAPLTPALDAVLDGLAELEARSRVWVDEPVPSYGDQLADQIGQRFLALDMESQSEIRESISLEFGRVLVVFSGRLALWAARAQAPEKVSSALALHAIEDFRFDPRENYRVFSIIGDACGRAGRPVSELWALTQGAFSEENAHHAENAASPRALASMGLKAVVRDGVLDYEPA